MSVWFRWNIGAKVVLCYYNVRVVWTWRNTLISYIGIRWFIHTLEQNPPGGKNHLIECYFIQEYKVIHSHTSRKIHVQIRRSPAVRCYEPHFITVPQGGRGYIQLHRSKYLTAAGIGRKIALFLYRERSNTAATIKSKIKAINSFQTPIMLNMTTAISQRQPVLPPPPLPPPR